jgi:serine/threonine protein kinase
MTSERWHRIEELYHAARTQPSSARAAFLHAACDGDSTLVREVESLIAQNDATTTHGAPGIAAPWVTDERGPLEGQRIGVYEIGPLIGAGGMGEVYRARDSRLRRDVAIKVLPSAFTSDPERLARFEREARILAALNHPYIEAIYGFEETESVRALVLEFVDGETLAERLARGSVPLREALALARQIADALHAAHQKGIIHRDLKPANIKLTPAGTVKVLDFSLAKTSALAAGAGDAGRTGTMTFGGTREGVVLGTVAYMSPEQARGHAVDHRTDIWAFGCVLYELVAGRSPFGGDTIGDVFAAVLDGTPEWTVVPPQTPAAVVRLLQQCLEKDPDRRSNDLGAVGAEIERTLTRLPPAGASGFQAMAARIFERWRYGRTRSR